MHEGIGWIVEADVRGDFDSIDRTRLREALHHRVHDGRILRLMGQWLRAGVMEAGVLHHPETGVVPGGTMSPVLANILRHQVLEVWCEHEVEPRLQGRSFLIRFADACVIGCEREADARRIMAVLPQRFARYGLTIHPTKTALMAFGKPAGRPGAEPRNGTCDFRGLTHSWTPSRRGCWVIKRRTASKRLRRTQKAWWRWCHANRHAPLNDQYQRLCLKLRGPFRYYGIQGNLRWREAVRRSAEKAWRYGLSRRSSTSAMGWEKCQQLLETSVLPTPRIVHSISWAMQGSTVMHQSRAGTLAPEEPDAFIAHVRVCRGAGWVTTGSTRKPTPYSLRSCLASAFGRGSLRALD
jgi:RNA-directed DNA polymerase